MKGQINLIYVGILTLISLAIFGTLVIWNFSITETSTNKASEVQMEIIANQVLEDINYLSSFESNSVYRVKKSFPNTINEDDYCIRLFQDESGDKRIYITKSGNSLSYSSFKKTDIYVDVANKNIDFENTISCGGNVNIVRNQTIISISNDEFGVAVPIVDVPPSISSIVDQSTNEDTQKVIDFSVSDESLTTLSLTSISGNTELVNQTENGGIIIPSSSTSSRTITLVPNSNKFGVVEINITATDDSSQTYTESFNITINSVNDIPTISFPGNQIIDVFTSTGLLPFTINDVETGCEFLTLSKATSQSSVIQLSDISITDTGNSCNKNVEVTSTQSGSGNTGISIITLTVGDGSDFSNTNFQITVNNFDSGGGGSCTEVSVPEVNCNPPGIPGGTWTDGTYCYDNDACESGDENENVIGDYCSEPFVGEVCSSNPEVEPEDPFDPGDLINPIGPGDLIDPIGGGQIADPFDPGGDGP